MTLRRHLLMCAALLDSVELCAVSLREKIPLHIKKAFCTGDGEWQEGGKRSVDIDYTHCMMTDETYTSALGSGIRTSIIDDSLSSGAFEIPGYPRRCINSLSRFGRGGYYRRRPWLDYSSVN